MPIIKINKNPTPQCNGLQLSNIMQLQQILNKNLNSDRLFWTSPPSRYMDTYPCILGQISAPEERRGQVVLSRPSRERFLKHCPTGWALVAQHGDHVSKHGPLSFTGDVAQGSEIEGARRPPEYGGESMECICSLRLSFRDSCPVWQGVSKAPTPPSLAQILTSPIQVWPWLTSNLLSKFCC